MDTELIWGLVRVVLALVIVVPLTVLAARWYAKRQVGGQTLRVREALSLGANRGLYLVVWEDKQFLLGVTAQQITLLAEKPLSQTDEKEVTE